ncbi:N-acetyltransferase domain-containing protein [Aphelenchoides fujianensis]|nr:N-acetyltransferase domain-containing protein [Aphelenchoides fujianensis]
MTASRWASGLVAAAIAAKHAHVGRTMAARLRPRLSPTADRLAAKAALREYPARADVLREMPQLVTDAQSELDYSIVKTTERDAAEVLDFMLEDFLFTEPLNAAVNLQADEARVFFKEIVEAGLSCPLNYVVRNKDGKIVGDDRASGRCRRTTTRSSRPKKNPKVREIQRLLSTIESKVWQLAPPDVNTPLFSTRRGLGRKLLEYKLDEVRALGCDGLVTTCSAFNSQQLFAKCGYEELFAIDLADWKNEKNEQIFRPLDATSKVNLVLKRL